MNAKPNVPEEVFVMEKDYSWRADWRVNGWLMVAAVISAGGDILFAHAVKQWPMGGQAALGAAEFLALALWARRLVRWIRGMDELHRRITTAAVLFAVSATFFCLMLWHRLERAGLFDAIRPGSKNGVGWDICTVAHGSLLLALFYFAGFSFFNRRYK